MNLKEVIEQKPHARIEIFETLKRGDAIMLDRDPITDARLICPRILLNPLDYRDYRFTVDPTFSKVQFHIDRIKKVGFDLERKKEELNSWIDSKINLIIGKYAVADLIKGFGDLEDAGVGFLEALTDFKPTFDLNLKLGVGISEPQEIFAYNPESP